jgi:hypothetical protein
MHFYKDTLDQLDDDKWRNVRGDHMLPLQHFEWFVDAKRKAKIGQVKKKCVERGLNFRVLSAVQEDVERCYRELKQRQLIATIVPNQRETLDDSCVESEFLGRIITSVTFTMSLIASKGTRRVLDSST